MAAEGTLRGKRLASLAGDLRAVSLSLSGPEEAEGKAERGPSWVSVGRSGYPAWFRARYGARENGEVYREADSRERYQPSNNTGYPDLVELAGRIDLGETKALAPDLLKARDFIEKECISDEGPNSPERLTIATAVERAVVDFVRRATGDPRLPALAALLEMVERAAIGRSRRFGPDADNAENLRLRTGKLAAAGVRPIPALNVFLLGARFLEEAFP
jgi:hypothetical protein